MPMAIMDIKDATSSREADFGFYKLLSINSSPNIEYILTNPRSRVSVMEKLYKDYMDNSITQKSFQTIVHQNGWAETIMLNNNDVGVGRSIDKLIKYLIN